MAKSNFDWVVGKDPPPLRSHSAAKLNIIRDYLSRYLDTVAPDPRQDKLSLSLVDGFSGGGAYLSKGERVPGSPIVMMEAVAEAEKRLNRNRTKPFRIEATYYFVDKSAAAIEFLKNEIVQIGHGHELGTAIHLINAPFEDAVDKIVGDIKSRTTAGRSLFLLDQFGWNKVAFQTIREILNTLNRSEVILTFAVDWLIDYMNEQATFLAAIAPIEISTEQVRRFIEERGRRGGRFLIQRLLLSHLQASIQPKFFTPFFIRSTEAGRNLWLVHLSKHPTARNVMVSTHWSIQNHSIHQGTGGLNMLGFNPDWEDTLPLDFVFDGNAHAIVAQALFEQLPSALAEAPIDSPLSFEALVAMHANTTTATVDQLERALMGLMQENEIEILTASGRAKKQGAKINANDRLIIPRQTFFRFDIPKK